MDDNGNHVSQGGYGIIEIQKMDIGLSIEVFSQKSGTNYLPYAFTE